jgi:hypothetical protein
MTPRMLRKRGFVTEPSVVPVRSKKSDAKMARCATAAIARIAMLLGSLRNACQNAQKGMTNRRT